MDFIPSGSPVLGIYQATHQSGLPLPPPGDLHNPGIKPSFPALDSLLLSHPEALSKLSQYLLTL